MIEPNKKNYQRLLSGVLVVAVTIPILNSTFAQEQGSGEKNVEMAIRTASRQFVEAFDRGDAQAISLHFASDGVYVNEQGERFAGREAIEREYATLFQNASGFRLSLEIDSIRQISPTTVIEEGRAALAPQPAGVNRMMSIYTAVHTLQDGKWLMSHVRDTSIEMPPDLGQLQDLDWLIGTWVAEGESARVEVTGRWIKGNRFMVRTHTVRESNDVTSTGLEVVGVDPTSGRITSWSFEGDGGHAIGSWAPHDDGWCVESMGTTGEGLETIATHHLSKQDDDTLIWHSIDRWAGDDTLPDIPKVILKRQ